MSQSQEGIFFKAWPAVAVLALLTFDTGWFPANGTVTGTDLVRPAFAEPMPSQTASKDAADSKRDWIQFHEANSDLSTIYFWPASFESYRNPAFEAATARSGVSSGAAQPAGSTNAQSPQQRVPTPDRRQGACEEAPRLTVEKQMKDTRLACADLDVEIVPWSDLAMFARETRAKG